MEAEEHTVWSLPPAATASCDTGDRGTAGYSEEKGPSAPRATCGTSTFHEFTKYALSLLVLLPLPTKDCKVCLQQ